MRVSTAFCRLLCLPGVWVRSVSFEPDRVVVTVALRARLLRCPKCSYSTRHRESRQHHDSVWRHLDLGRWRLEVHARLRRVRCPEHGTLVVAWRKGHRYLTIIGDHRRRCVVWGCEGKGKAAADELLAELDPEPHRPPQTPEPAQPGEIAAEQPAEADAEHQIGERACKLRAVSMDMGEGYAKSVREHAPQATICIDNFHVVQLATKALDEVRREHWNELRATGEPDAAKQFKDSRWSLLKNPGDLTDRQLDTLTALHAAGGKVPRAWAMKEMVRAIFAPGLTPDTVAELIDLLLARLPAAASNRSCASDARSASTARGSSPPGD